MNKVEGRRKGIKAAARKELEDLRDRAEAKRPGITHLMESYAIPKDVKRELENNEMLQQKAAKMGIDKDRVPFVQLESQLNLSALKTPEQRKKDKSPFAPKNHKISVINRDDE